MTANNSPMVRVFQLMTSVADLVLRGKRDPDQVAEVLQQIKDNSDFVPVIPGERRGSEKCPCAVCQLKDWEEFYKEVFGLERDFSGLRFPVRKPGFHRLIVVAQGMTPRRLYKRMKELMSAWKHWDNFDSIISERKADQDYAIWVRDRVEADEELKNKSADDLKKEGIQGITLEERLLFELKYFKETGKHLDEQNWTICAGSRDSRGGVLCVIWDSIDRGLRVYWYDSDFAHGLLRARAVVS